MSTFRFTQDLPATKHEDDSAEAKHGGTAAGGSGSSANYADNVPFGARQGHGFAAERANHLYDSLTGRDADLVGGNNAKNGPDRIVDGATIQTKYCASGKQCIDACFEGDKFRYAVNGKAMQIEVPSDMYEDAVAEMAERIRKGQVKVDGVNSPQDAEKLVRKGNFTYAQAKNIAKFGTIESLTYDAVNGVSVAGSAMGITALITMAVKLWSGEKWQSALDAACFEGLCVGGVAWASSIAAAQMGRTGLEASMRSGTDWLVKQMGAKVASTLANTMRPAGKEIYGQAAKNHVSKLLRGNIATTIAVSAVLSVDDLHSLFVKEISGTQAFKNIASTTSGVAGGSVGWAWGAAVGSVFPGLGTVLGGAIGAVAGGIAGSTVMKKLLNEVWEDDSVSNGQMLEASFLEIADDYLLSDKEAAAVLKGFREFIDLEKRMKQMQAFTNKRSFAINMWMPFVKEQVQKRAFVRVPTSKQISDSIVRIAEQIDGGQPADEEPSQTKSADAPSGFWSLLTENREGFADEPASSRSYEPNFILVGASPNLISKNEGLVQSLADVYARAKAMLDEFSEVPPPAPKPTIRPLSAFIEPFEDTIGDGSTVFAGRELFTRKGQEKQEAGRKYLAMNDYEDALVVMDSTTWKSVKEGIFITDTFLYCKALFEDRMAFRIDEIKSIRIDADDKALIVNGKQCNYGYESATKPLMLAVKCIKEYLAQFH